MTRIFQEAAPISRVELEEVGWKVREALGFTKIRWLPVPQIVEHMLPALYGDAFAFRVGDSSELGTNHAFADTEGLELVLRDDVYDRMVAGHGRDRMTAIHEMSHLILHQRQRLYRRMRDDPPPPFRDPEWQAKCLAGTTMMPIPLMRGLTTVHQIVREFGVSHDAASYRLKQIGGTK